MSPSIRNAAQNDNDITLQSYQNRTQEYIEGTPPVDDALKAWIDKCLSLMSKDGKILEIGSGFGRDTEYITSRGFDIECSDAVPNFVELLKRKGFQARMLNVLKDKIQGTYDMIFADAVLLHFTPEEAARVARNIYAGLNDSGIFAFSVKKGSGPAWTDAKLGEPRYFYYWESEELKKAFADWGFRWLSLDENYTSYNDTSWLDVIVRKRS